MKLKRLYILFLVIFCWGSTASANIDSLQAAFPKADDEQKLEILFKVSDFYMVKDFEKSLDASKQGFTIASKTNNILFQGKFLSHIGLAHYFKGNYDSASQYYSQALQVLSSPSGEIARPYVLNFVGRLYRKLKDNKRALSYYDEALALYQKANDADGMATIYNESGVVFEYMGRFNEARDRYRKSLAIRELQNDLLGQSYSLEFIGSAYREEKNIGEAEKYLLQSLKIREQIRDSFSIAATYGQLAGMHMDAKNFAAALDYYQKALNIQQGMEYLQGKAETYKGISVVYEKMGNSNEALKFYRLADAVGDSLMSAEKLKQIEELNTRYETDKKDNELKLRNLQFSRRNVLIYSALGMIGLLVLLGIYIYRKRELMHSLNLQKTILAEQEKATQEILVAEEQERERIARDLHDGVGQTMSAARMNLSAFADKLNFANESDQQAYTKIIGLVDESCKEVRSISHSMMPLALSNKNLSVAIESFLARIDEKVLKVSFYAEGDENILDKNAQSVVYRVVQECVNNVVKHADAKIIDIAMYYEPAGMSLTIEDDGKGFDANNKHLYEGIGLKNILSRINYLKGSLDINSAPGKGSLFSIFIPAKTEFIV